MRKILIIEDETDLLKVLEYVFNSFDYDVFSSTGIMSLSAISEISPDVILLDYQLSDGFGNELCSELKSEPKMSGIPVVMVSAHDALPSIARDCCADAYLAKPFDINKLQGIINRLINDRAA